MAKEASVYAPLQEGSTAAPAGDLHACDLSRVEAAPEEQHHGRDGATIGNTDAQSFGVGASFHGAPRYIRPALFLTFGMLLGAFVHENFQQKITAPTKMGPSPMSTEEFKEMMEGKVSLTSFVKIVDYDHDCDKEGATSLKCSPGSTCCQNDAGALYCCAATNVCHANVCIATVPICFPGEAKAIVRGQGATEMRDLKVGERVLIQKPSGSLDFEPILAFLHVAPTEPGRLDKYLTVMHSEGQVRASPNHVLFHADGRDTSAAKLAVGDELLTSEGRAAQVLEILESEGNSGMYAPLTASGTIIVDGVVASNYALPSLSSWIPHRAMHAAFFPVRVYYALGLGSASSDKTSGEIMHPFAKVLLNYSPWATLFGK